MATKFNSTEKRYSYQTLPYGKIDCSLKSTEVTKQRKLQLLAKSKQSAKIKLNENSVADIRSSIIFLDDNIFIFRHAYPKI